VGAPTVVPPDNTLHHATSVQSLETNAQHADPDRWLSPEIRLECPRWFRELPISHSSIFRHSGWDHDRQRVHHAMQCAGVPLPRLVAFESCGAHARVLQSLDDQSRYRIAGSYCHDRFCLPCGQERARTIARNTLEILDGRPCRFITLTVRAAGLDLASAIEHLRASFCRLRRTAEWRSHVDGGAAFLELKWIGSSQRWHPHYHMLVEGKYFPHELLKQLWKQSTGDSDIVDIRYVRDERKITRYVVKYASKPIGHDLIADEDRLVEVILALKGKRLCLTFGTWRGYRLAVVNTEGAWIDVGDLDTWIARAASGDAIARKVLVGIGKASAEAAIAHPRPPPEVSVVRNPSPQLTFKWDTAA